MARVAVIGGGAAGMMAAIAAAGNGAEVTVYEKNDRVGKKILATGNGKCNFSNRDFSVGYYNGNGLKGADCRRLEHFFRQFSMEDAVNFFEMAGMLVKEKNGYLYPWSEQASTVLDILRLELRRLKVEVRTLAEIDGINEIDRLNGTDGISGIGGINGTDGISGISGINGIDGVNGIGATGGIEEKTEGVREKNERKVTLQGGGGRKFRLLPFEDDGIYDAVVVACGGCAAAKTGSDGGGYKLAGQLGHRIVPTVPSLVQLRCSDGFFKIVAGVRCEAGITLYAGAGTAGRERVQEERGELQFTDYGISGIPVFQLSRQAAYLLREKKTVTTSIDFFPCMDRQEFEELCAKRLSGAKGKNMEEFLLGMANKKINLLMLKLAGLKPEQKTGAAGRKELKRLLFSYRALQVHVSAANSFEQAQVTAGGVDMAEISDKLSSVKVPGVYFAGEVLDVDGRCGGYNLQWAWTSGYIAGKNAALGLDWH